MKKNNRSLKFIALIAACLVLSVAAFSIVSSSASNDPLVTLSYLTDILFPQWQKDVQAQNIIDIDAAVASRLDYVVEDKVENSVNSAVASSLASSIPQVVNNAVASTVPSLVEAAVANAVSNAVDNAVSDAVASAMANVTVSAGTPTQPEQPYAAASSGNAYTLLELPKGTCLYTHSTLEMIVRAGSDVEVISPFDAQGIADITNAVEYLDKDKPVINSYLLIPRGDDGRGIRVLNDLSYILVRGDYYFG